MSRNRIVIENLEVRLKGVTPERAGAAIDGLGDALMRHFSSGWRGGPAGSTRIDAIDAGEERMEHGTSATELRDAIVARIGSEIERRITQ